MGHIGTPRGLVYPHSTDERQRKVTRKLDSLVEATKEQVRNGHRDEKVR
ncbi:hypothetical protein ABZ470_09575 [Streptosporangium sp. NPDC020072]